MTPIVVTSDLYGDQPAVALSVTLFVIVLAAPLLLPMPKDAAVLVRFEGAAGADILAVCTAHAGDVLRIWELHDGNVPGETEALPH